ncbi:beta-glucan synthesis-associated protein [Oleoguttula sp. CCFEE 5521]
MDNDPSLPPPRHAPPHIRLNSGSGDLLNIDQQQQNDSQSRPQTARQPSSRSLTSAGAAQAARPGTAGSLRQPGVYDNQGPQESAELLLPPRRNKTRRFRDEDSPTASGFNSRRTSWSSESAGSRDSRYGGPFASPFDDSRAPSRAGSDEDGVNTQTVSEKYNILPSAGLLLFPEDVEKDDYLHNPDPNEKEKLDCSDLFSKRGLVNVGGLALITLGVLILFIGYPILTFVQKAIKPAGSDLCKLDPNCLKGNVATLKNVRTSLIDPDTPKSAMSRKDTNGNTQNLVFSDEFNEDGRTFYPGDDAYFTAMDFWYGATQDLEWYDPDAATTKDGLLTLKFDAFQSHNLNYRSGMLQSWNQMCFKGGYMEAAISLPGRGDTIGFWPGFWAMGNLGRPGYLSTTDGMWPYSYHDECDVGITWNQSDPDGLSSLPGMRLPGCSCEGEDHPSPGLARSAPEIDALEASVGHLDANNQVGSASQSFQVAPFDLLWRPNTDAIEVYDGAVSAMNSYQGGVYQQALSTVTLLNNKWYDGNAYQKYGFEYTPGEDGYILWNVGDVDTWKVTGAATGPNGNVGQRVIPEEPLALVLNFGMSTGFAELNLTGLAPLMPATMRIDYVRIYQGDGDELTCDPAGYPTTEYIANHGEAYTNPNLTHWDKAGYSWPQNSFVDQCSTSTQSGKNKERKMAHKAKKAKRSWVPWR